MSGSEALVSAPASPTLTSHLLNDPAHVTTLDRATRHIFLHHAGSGTLPAEILQTWLQQDVHYTRAYVRFLGGLLSRLTLPTSIYSSGPPDNSQPKTGHERKKKLEYRILGLIISALGNIQREMEFFEDTVAQYSLELDASAPAEPITRAYVDMFDAAGSGSGTLLRALVVLWATEWCYFKAWTYALEQQQSQSSAPSSDADTATTAATKAIQEAFIPNWTSEEFGAFVQECADVVNDVAVSEGIHAALEAAPDGGEAAEEGGRRGSGLAKRGLKVCESAFAHVLWLEGRFWPDVNDTAAPVLDDLQESRSDGFARDWD